MRTALLVGIALLWIGVLGAPLHETGHVLACSFLGVRVLKVELFRVLVHPADVARLNMVAVAAGGLFSGMILFGFYAALDSIMFPGEKFVTLDGKIGLRNKASVLKDWRLAVLEITKVTFFAAAATEIVNGLLEGFFPGIYDLNLQFPLLPLILLTCLTLLSVEFERRRLEKRLMKYPS